MQSPFQVLGVFHEFIPLTENTIAMKYCSKDEEVVTTFSFSHENESAPNVNRESPDNINPLYFVSCLYNQHWWIGLVIEKDEHEEDLKIKFMHPHGPSPSFVWPSFEDICWVPNNEILCKIDSPSTKTGRSYVVSETDILRIVSKVD